LGDTPAIAVAAEARPAYGSRAATSSGLPAPKVDAAASGSQRSAEDSSAAMASSKRSPGRNGSAEHQLPLTAFSSSSGLSEHRERLRQALGLYAPPPVEETAAQADSAVAAAPTGAMPAQATATAQPTAPQHTGRLLFASAHYLGQLLGTYLLCEQGDELCLIDQHAAHERVVFERLRRGLLSGGDEGTLTSQRLLFPISLELDARASALLEEHAAILSRLGFEVRPFGGRSFALVAAPDLGAYGRGAEVHRDPESLLRQVLDELDEHGRSDALAGRRDLLIATMACHAAVRAGDVLDEAKARALFSAMDEVDYSPHCPHGRPVLVRMSRSEIEKRFGRS
jgi:DNA mismatch repair protein MutL